MIQISFGQSLQTIVLWSDVVTEVDLERKAGVVDDQGASQEVILDGVLLEGSQMMSSKTVAAKQSVIER